MIPAIQSDRYRELREHIKWLNDLLAKTLKEKKVFKFRDEHIGEFGFAGVSHLIANSLEGYLHPGKLCVALLQAVQSLGVVVLSSTTISSFEEHSNGLTLFTDRNITLSARQLLVCTNAFARELLPDIDVIPARGQILVTAPIPSLRIRGTFHYDEGYYYFRNVGNRLLLGGARNLAVNEERTVEMSTTPLIQDALEEFISGHLLPDTPFEITDRWSGIMGMGAEKLPVVKKLTRNIFCAVKMSGMGVALAPIAADTVTSLMID